MKRRAVRRRRRKQRIFAVSPSSGLLLLLAIGVCSVLCVNATVRSLGGDVSPLALARLRERTEALFLLANHQLRAVYFPAPKEPRVALQEAALRHRVAPSLVLAVATVESGLVPTRVSGTGAMGLMQLMPATARELGVTDPFDSAQNADAGTRYLKSMLVAYRGDVRRALAAYNAGPLRVPAKGSSAWPYETRVYVMRVLALR